MSTSSTARAIVRDLAALHVHHDGTKARLRGDFSSSGLGTFLPPFPEVSAYIGEEYTATSLSRIDEEEPGAADAGITSQGDATDRPARANKVAARKHRELIKERTKNVRRCPVLSFAHSTADTPI